MEKETKDRLTAAGTWRRLPYMVLFAVIFNIAELVFVAVVVIQFLLKLFTGDVAPKLSDLGQKLGTYAGWIIRFLTYNTEEMPYPFAPWPGAANEEAAPPTPAKSRAASKKKSAK